MIFVKVNTGLLTLLDAATKVMQDEMIKNVSNIGKYQPIFLLHDQFVLVFQGTSIFIHMKLLKYIIARVELIMRPP